MSQSRGFTLIELIVVVLIIGMLMALAIPQYNRTVEVAKAESAIAVVQMIGAANRMFKLDKAGYAAGSLDGCTTKSKPNPVNCTASNGAGDACYLMWCGYLATQGFNQDSTPYEYSAFDPGSPPSNNTCFGLSGQPFTACAKRRTVGAAKTDDTCYNGWAFGYANTGAMSRSAGTEEKCTPPTPPS